jgi:sigma-E factor negative regulatory protein RseA
VVARKDFLAGIQLGLEDEPVYDEKVVEFARPAIKADVKLPNMNQRYVKYGMAAAVAAVAVVSGTMLLKKPSPTPEALAAAQPIQPAALVQLAQAAPIRSANQLDPQSRDVLKQYVAQHVKYASTTAIVPSVRAVSYSNDY